MKRILAILLLAAVLGALFAACTPANPAPSASGQPSATPSASESGAAVTDAPAPDDTAGGIAADAGAILPPMLPAITDTLAVNADGTLKYYLDDKNYPADWYDYELPLTTTADSFTYWTMTYTNAALIPDEGIGAMAYQTMLRDKTGVNIEYIVNPPYEALTLYQLMIASEDISDLVCYASWYWQIGGGGQETDMVDQNFFVNIADYRAYAPNYLYQVPRFDYDPELIAAMWTNEEMITSVGGMADNPMPGTGWVIRGDWLDRLSDAPKAADIKTYAQLEDVLTRFKNEVITSPVGFPMIVWQVIELTAGDLFAGMNTSMSVGVPATKIVDGKVKFTMSEEVDYQALELLLDWFDKGLIDPGYTSYRNTNEAATLLNSDAIGLIVMTPGEVGGYEMNSATPDARWDAIPHPALTENWQFRYTRGLKQWTLSHYGWGISAECKNIPLMVTYCDYFYSNEGAFDGSWGVEGVTYEFDGNGAPYLTDQVLNNDLGLSVAWYLYAFGQSAFYETTRSVPGASFAYPGGERYAQMSQLWFKNYYRPDPFGVSYDWPSILAKPSVAQTADIQTFMPDAQTWFTENYNLFLGRSSPLTPDNWMEYRTNLYAQGYERYALIMQNVYDEYMDRLRGIASN